MAIAAIGTNVQAENNGTDTVSVSHTLPAGSDRMIVAVGNCEAQDLSAGGATATYGGVTMTEVGEALVDSTFDQSSVVFVVNESDISGLSDDTSYTCTINWNCSDVVGHTNDAVHIAVLAYSGVDQTTPTGGAIQTATATSSSAAQTLTFTGGSNGDLYVGGMSLGQSNTITWGGDETPTELYDEDVNATLRGGVSELFSDGTVGDITATPSASTNRLATIGVRFSPAGAGGATVYPPWPRRSSTLLRM